MAVQLLAAAIGPFPLAGPPTVSGHQKHWACDHRVLLPALW